VFEQGAPWRLRDGCAKGCPYTQAALPPGVDLEDLAARPDDEAGLTSGERGHVPSLGSGGRGNRFVPAVQLDCQTSPYALAFPLRKAARSASLGIYRNTLQGSRGHRETVGANSTVEARHDGADRRARRRRSEHRLVRLERQAGSLPADARARS